MIESRQVSQAPRCRFGGELAEFPPLRLVALSAPPSPGAGSPVPAGDMGRTAGRFVQDVQASLRVSRNNGSAASNGHSDLFLKYRAFFKLKKAWSIWALYAESWSRKRPLLKITT